MSTFNLRGLYKDFDSKLRGSYRVRETSEEVREAQRQKLKEEIKKKLEEDSYSIFFISFSIVCPTPIKSSFFFSPNSVF